MNEERSPDVHKGLLAQLISFIPRDMREGVGAFIACIIMVGLIISTFTWIAESGKPKTECWQVRKVDERWLKLNACTGETVELFMDKVTASPITK